VGGDRSDYSKPNIDKKLIIPVIACVGLQDLSFNENCLPEIDLIVGSGGH
jgi:hypothetical protein